MSRVKSQMMLSLSPDIKTGISEYAKELGTNVSAIADRLFKALLSTREKAKSGEKIALWVQELSGIIPCDDSLYSKESLAEMIERKHS